jgi:hypothetical protein
MVAAAASIHIKPSPVGVPYPCKGEVVLRHVQDHDNAASIGRIRRYGDPQVEVKASFLQREIRWLSLQVTIPVCKIKF